jgi:L-fuculose-phosphate aldolase
LKTQQQFASQVKEEIPPILDDQAQLLGVSVRIANTEQNITKALNNRFAANVIDGTSFCIGNTLEDAYVAAQLLEKTSKVFVEAKALGGAKPINKIEAWFMQQYYLLKYSKEAEKNV